MRAAFEEPDDAVRQEIDDDDEDEAEDDREMVGEIGADEIEQEDERHHAEKRSVKAARRRRGAP